MIAAIRWVHDNIGAFGGDPANVTVMGQSAGAHSIMFMQTMPDVRALFCRAILHSPPARIAPLSRERAAEWTAAYARVLGWADLGHRQLRDALRSAAPDTLLHAAATLARNTSRLGQVEPPIMPVVDRLSDPDFFLEEAARGAADAGVSVIVGTNRDEALAIVAGDPRAQSADRDQVDECLRRTPGDTAAGRVRRSRPVDTLAEVMTDVAFTTPSQLFAARAVRYGAHVWMYRLDWAPTGSPLGACHCLELPLVFDTEQAWSNARMMQHRSGPHDGAPVAHALRDAWLSFAHTGTPLTRNPWPEYNHDSDSIMKFDRVCEADRASE